MRHNTNNFRSFQPAKTQHKRSKRSKQKSNKNKNYRRLQKQCKELSEVFDQYSKKSWRMIMNKNLFLDWTITPESIDSKYKPHEFASNVLSNYCTTIPIQIVNKLGPQNHLHNKLLQHIIFTYKKRHNKLVKLFIKTVEQLDYIQILKNEFYEIPIDIYSIIINYISVSFNCNNNNNNNNNMSDNNFIDNFNCLKNDIDNLIHDELFYSVDLLEFPIPKTFFLKRMKYRKRNLQFHMPRRSAFGRCIHWDDDNYSCYNYNDNVYSKSKLYICNVGECLNSIGNVFEHSIHYVILIQTQFVVYGDMVQLFGDAQSSFANFCISLVYHSDINQEPYSFKINPVVCHQFTLTIDDSSSCLRYKSLKCRCKDLHHHFCMSKK